MNFLKKHYKNTIRSLIISKHNIINISQIPKIKNVNFRVKTDLKNNPKLWVLLFWSSFLLTGQKPFVKKKKKLHLLQILLIFTVLKSV
jgi:ribosomal protein L5